MIRYAYKPSGARPDATQRRCYDCAHLKAAVGLWCTSEEAARSRGTRIPGIRDCPHWAPMRRATLRDTLGFGDEVIELTVGGADAAGCACGGVG